MTERGIQKRGFHIGDRVVIVKSPTPERIGQIATVVSRLQPMENPIPDWVRFGAIHGTPAHELDLEGLPQHGHFPGVVAYPPGCLELYRDDGNEKVSWEDLPGSRGR